jgi:hypothetical protein
MPLVAAPTERQRCERAAAQTRYTGSGRLAARMSNSIVEAVLSIDP